MTRIVSIDHADQRIARRGLDPAWIARPLAEPEAQESDPGHPERTRAYRALPERDGRVLRVIYERSDDEIRVITAFLDRTRTRRLKR